MKLTIHQDIAEALKNAGLLFDVEKAIPVIARVMGSLGLTGSYDTWPDEKDSANAGNTDSVEAATHGGQRLPTGRVEQFQGDYRFLSNFWPCLVLFDGMEFKSAEHAYQAAKTVVTEERRLIASLPTPGQAKRQGKRVTLRPNWDAMKIMVMTDIVRSKFSNNNEPLRAQLLDTGSKELIEGNGWGDRFWGVFKGEGRNELGKALMLVRSELLAGTGANKGAES